MANEYSRRFELKGKEAEEFLYTLATKTFLTDWCYLNPKLPNGKELCDLLVVFDDTVIIWQVKDLKLDKQGRYSESEVEKNLRQLAGARRMLFEVKATLDLENPRRGREQFDPAKIKHVYLISAFMGELQNYQRLFGEAKANVAHVFTREFTEIVLSELDTIADFTKYLADKEAVLFHGPAHSLRVLGGEEELLAIYLQHDRSFSFFDEPKAFVLVQPGFWESLQQDPQHIAKKEDDEISYAWDGIIDTAHLSGTPEYEHVAREMARLNRFERRVVSQAMFDAMSEARKALQNGQNIYRRAVFGEGTTTCFVYADKNTISTEGRRNMLASFCFVTRGTVPPAPYTQSTKVIGIATEMQVDVPRTFDIVYLDKPEWTTEDEATAAKLKQALGIGKKVTTHQVQAHEYRKRR